MCFYPTYPRARYALGLLTTAVRDAAFAMSPCRRATGPSPSPPSPDDPPNPMSPQLAEARCAALANENSQLREALRRLGPSKAADDGEAVAVVPAVETSPGVAQAQPRLEVQAVECTRSRTRVPRCCAKKEFGSAPDASSSVEDDDGCLTRRAATHFSAENVLLHHGEPVSPSTFWPST